MAFMVLGYLAFAGPSPAKESARRLQSVRYRHSESTIDKVEAQLKAIYAKLTPWQKTQVARHPQRRDGRGGVGPALARDVENDRR